MKMMQSTNCQDPNWQMGYRHEKLKPAILRLTGRKTCRKEIVQTNRRRKKAAFQTCSKSEGRFGLDAFQ